MEHKPKRQPGIRPPVDQMTPSELIAAAIYLPVHVFALPLVVLPLVQRAFSLSMVDINLVYYVAGFSFLLTVFWRYLRRGFDTALDAPGAFVFSVLGAYVVEFFLTQLLALALSLFVSSTVTSPNNENIPAMAPQGLNRLIAISVFLGPLVEEILFRGFIFGSLSKRSRAAAWVVSAAAFSLYHVWQYIPSDGLAALVSAVLYIPGSIALNWSFERTGSIWSPIAYHMLSNAIILFAY